MYNRDTTHKYSFHLLFSSLTNHPWLHSTARLLWEPANFEFFSCLLSPIIISCPSTSLLTFVTEGRVALPNRMNFWKSSNFNPKIYSALFGPLARFFSDIFWRKKLQLDPVGSTVRYEMMKLCTGQVSRTPDWLTHWQLWKIGLLSSL